LRTLRNSPKIKRRQRCTSIDHPDVSRWIVDRKLANARSTGAQVLASDNPGCISHLRGAAHAARDQFEVCHFVELLAERLSGEDRKEY
jgi:Fe-S oxidoreductase